MENFRKKSKIYKRILLVLLSSCMGYSMMSSYIFANSNGIDVTNSDEIAQQNSYQYESTSGKFTSITSNMSPIQEDDFKAIQGDYKFELKNPEQRTLKGGDYYYISLPERAKVTPSTKSSEIVDNENAIIANWDIVEINNEHRVKVIFTSYVEDVNIYDIKGEFSFTFELNLEKNADGSPIKVDLPLTKDSTTNLQIIPHVEFPTTPTELEKQGSYNKDTHEITWMISLKNQKQDWTGYTFIDTLSNQLSMVTVRTLDDAKIETTLDSSSYLFNNNTLTIPSLNSSMKTIKLVTRVNKDVYENNDETIIQNCARIENNINPDHPISIASNTESIPVKKNWLSKSGKVSDGNLIEWKILVNEEKLKMKNAVVSDTLSSNLAFDENTLLTIKDGKDTTTLKADGIVVNGMSATLSSTKELKIYLPKESNANTYTMTFKTAVDPIAPDKKYTNSATLAVDYWTGEKDNYLSWKSPSIGTGDIEVPSLSLAKSGKLTDEKKGILTWTLQAATNSETYTNSTIVDTLNGENEYEAFTGDVAFTDLSTGKRFALSMPIPTKENPTNTRREETINGKNVIIEFQGIPYAKNQSVAFTFPDENAFQNTIKIELTTQAKDSIYIGKDIAEGKLIFKNSAKASTYDTTGTLQSTKDTTSTVEASNPINTKANLTKASYPKKDSLPNPNNTIRSYFKLTINPKENTLEDVIIKDDLNKITTLFKKNGETNSQILRDAKWTLVSDSIIIEQKSTDGYTKAEIQDILHEAANGYKTSDNLLTFDFSKKALNSQYTIYFALDLAREEQGLPFKDNFINSNGAIAIQGNTSTLTHRLLKRDETINSKPSDKIELGTNTLIDKKGAYHKENGQIDYRININQRKQFLGNPLTIEDYMSAAITLDPSSVILYKDVLDEDGNFIEDLTKATVVPSSAYKVEYRPIRDPSHQNATSKITFSMPRTTDTCNDEAYILVYATDINEGHFDEVITNDAFIPTVADNGQSVSSQNKIEVHDFSGGTSTKRCGAKLHKADANGTSLEGATFQLFWSSNDTETFLKEAKTDKDGNVLFTGLKTNETYRIKESNAPVGYALSKDTWELTPKEAGKTYQRDRDFINIPLVSTPLTIQINKELTGKVWPKNRTFQVKLSHASRSTMLTDAISTLSYDKEVNTYTLSATHSTVTATLSYPYQTGDQYFYYKIEETNVPTGYKNVTGTYYLRVKVHGNDIDNTLSASIDKVIQVKDGVENTLDTTKVLQQNTLKLPMLNHYEAQPVTYKIAGKSSYHNMSTKNPNYLNPTFEYALYEEGITNPIACIVLNKDGSFSFPELSFNSANVGTHYYKIVVKHSLQDIQYDEEYTLEINVIDNDDGTLRIASTLKHKGKEVDDMLFQHTYVEDKVSVIPPKDTPKNDGSTTTLTGDSTSLTTMILVSIVSGMIGILLLIRKKASS